MLTNFFNAIVAIIKSKGVAKIFAT